VADQKQTRARYVLGAHPEEIARLDHQANLIERPTRLLLQAAGIQTGMRVLDLGTGLGHVARLTGELVGTTGSVVGIDQSTEMLTIARERTLAAGASHITFTTGDAVAWTSQSSFDAIVGRLLLFHVPDPVAVVRHHLANLRQGGLFVAIDFDIGACRSEPPVAIADTAFRWLNDAFRAAGAWPRIGARLGAILEEAGLAPTTTFGIQAYFSPRDGSGPAMLGGILRSLAPAIVGHGIATEEQLGLSTFEARLRDAVRQAGAVVLPPTVVGAWGRRAGA
jgi:ubiquinone/menaquinone biosynthesis C-methylase UbiE